MCVWLRGWGLRGGRAAAGRGQDMTKMTGLESHTLPVCVCVCNPAAASVWRCRPDRTLQMTNVAPGNTLLSPPTTSFSTTCWTVHGIWRQSCSLRLWSPFSPLPPFLLLPLCTHMHLVGFADSAVCTAAPPALLQVCVCRRFTNSDVWAEITQVMWVSLLWCVLFHIPPDPKSLSLRLTVNTLVTWSKAWLNACTSCSTVDYFAWAWLNINYLLI